MHLIVVTQRWHFSGHFQGDWAEEMVHLLADRGVSVHVLAAVSESVLLQKGYPDADSCGVVSSGGVVARVWREVFYETAGEWEEFSNWCRRQIDDIRKTHSDAVTLSFCSQVPAAVMHLWEGPMALGFARWAATRATVLGRLLARLRPILSRSLGALFACERRALHDACVRVILARYESEAGQMKRRWPRLGGKVEVLPPGVLLQKAEEEKWGGWREMLRNELGVDGDGVVFLLPLNLPEKDSVRLALQSLAEVRRREPGRRVYLWIAGHITYEAHCQVVKSGVQEWVRMLPVHERWEPLLSAADVLLTPMSVEVVGGFREEDGGRASSESLAEVQFCFVAPDRVVIVAMGAGLPILPMALLAAEVEAVSRRWVELLNPALRQELGKRVQAGAGRFTVSAHLDALMAILGGCAS